MRITALITVLTAAAFAAGCGSSGSSSAPVAPGSPTATDTTPAGGTTTGATIPRTQSTPTATTANRCTASKLALSFLGQQGATGHGVLGVALKNAQTTSCRTFGYPGVQFLSQSGRPLPTVSTRTTHDFGGSAPLRSLTVAPGATVSFRMVVTHGINSSKGCTTAYAVQVIPPNDTGTLRTMIPGGAYECGTTTVTPMQPGVTAYR